MQKISAQRGLRSSNVISSKHPAFAKLATKLDRARQELVKIDDYLESIKGFDRPVNGWARGSALALGIHNIYNGIEDVMLSLANDIDGYVPTGESARAPTLPRLGDVLVGDQLDPHAQLHAAAMGKARPLAPAQVVEIARTGF